MLAKAPRWNSRREEGMGRIKGSEEGAGREKRKQAAFWHEVKVV